MLDRTVVVQNFAEAGSVEHVKNICKLFGPPQHTGFGLEYGENFPPFVTAIYADAFSAKCAVRAINTLKCYGRGLTAFIPWDKDHFHEIGCSEFVNKFLKNNYLDTPSKLTRIIIKNAQIDADTLSALLRFGEIGYFGPIRGLEPNSYFKEIEYSLPSSAIIAFHSVRRRLGLSLLYSCNGFMCLSLRSSLPDPDDNLLPANITAVLLELMSTNLRQMSLFISQCQLAVSRFDLRWHLPGTLDCVKIFTRERETCTLAFEYAIFSDKPDSDDEVSSPTSSNARPRAIRIVNYEKFVIRFVNGNTVPLSAVASSAVTGLQVEERLPDAILSDQWVSALKLSIKANYDSSTGSVVAQFRVFNLEGAYSTIPRIAPEIDYTRASIAEPTQLHKVEKFKLPAGLYDETSPYSPFMHGSNDVHRTRLALNDLQNVNKYKIPIVICKTD